MQNEIRQGIFLASVNSKVLGIVGVEFLLLAIQMGTKYHSWYIFGILFLLPLALILLAPRYKVFSVILFLFLVFFTGIWTYMGYSFGKAFSQDASIVLGVIGLVIGALVNLNYFLFLLFSYVKQRHNTKN